MVADIKLHSLVSGARFDTCGYDPGQTLPDVRHFIYRAALPNGGCTRLLKVLLTSQCTNDCAYCVNQVGRDCPRHSFQPEELATIFADMHQARKVDGLFLTSGIGYDVNRTMEGMIKTVEILRYHHRFHGYIHLKVLPGSSYNLVEESCRIANRVSINMEAPTQQHLARLSSNKDLRGDILTHMDWIKHVLNKNKRFAPAGQTTQFVVGAAGETDKDIIRTANSLYSDKELRRVYFSAYRPVRGSRLAEVEACLPMREHRLYQVDWLLRDYGFTFKEVSLAVNRSGNLSLKTDPKLIIALKQPWLYPVDINAAGYDDLLRIPGIGILSAQKIAEARKEGPIFAMRQLQKMRVQIKKALPYIWFKGMPDAGKQLPLFGLEEEEAESIAPVQVSSSD